MKLPLLLASGLLVLPALSPKLSAQSLDPTFTPSSIYAPASTSSVAEQPDGKLVVLGSFTRVNGSAASTISRFNTNGSLDAAFQQNVGAAQGAFEIGMLSNGKLMVSSEGGDLTVGGLTRPGLVRLNADGAGDASFNIGTGPDGSAVYIDDFLELPNGQLMVMGAFDTFNGVPANGIVRLNTNGSVDATFNPGAGVAGSYTEVSTMVPLPNGQYLLGGIFDTYDGTPSNGLVRINANGSLDPTFSTNFGTDNYIINLTVQPDGKILVTGDLVVGASTTHQGLLRLLPNGTPDNSFTPPAFPTFDVITFSGAAMQVQPDGKILLLSRNGINSAGIRRVARLNANGTLDTSFQVGTGPNSTPLAIKLLANGRLLVAGLFSSFNGTQDRTLVQLNSAGGVDTSFLPVLQGPGTIRDVVQQADGKLVVGGYFSEINGQPIRRLARFNPNGTLDATFTAGSNSEYSVVDLALQPDGRLLVASSDVVLRLLSNGTTDNTFVAPSLTGSSITKMLLQSDGRVVLGGAIMYINGTSLPSRLARLMPDGTRDNTFVPSSATSIQALALQADGKLLVGLRNAVRRLQMDGTTDASFTSPVADTRALAVQPDGKILAGGQFLLTSGTTQYNNIMRLNTNGTVDTGFAPTTSFSPLSTVSTVLLQPNNRILLGGSFTGPGTNVARLLTTGLPDASFTATVTPNNTVLSLLVQSDGAIVLGGSFSAVNNLPFMALARITAPNVLHVAAPQAVAARTEAWPVPAQGSLHVATAPSAHPQTVELLDALGRPVLQQPLTGTATTLPLSEVKAGIYLLRVTYAEGVVSRRIQVQ